MRVGSEAVVTSAALDRVWPKPIVTVSRREVERVKQVTGERAPMVALGA
jgi:hypothetical protein